MKEKNCCPDCWNSPHALKTRFKDGICGLACETCTHGNFEREPLGSNWCMCGKPFRGLKYHDKSSHEKKETDADKQNKFFKHIHASKNTCVKSLGHTGDCEEPTQDTESWEGSFDEKFLYILFDNDLEKSNPLADALKQFIRQKKQHWQKQARTQGAEAAVEYIKKTTGIEDDFSIHSDYIIPYSVLEEARRV